MFTINVVISLYSGDLVNYRKYPITVLQIRGGIKDNSKIIFLIPQQNICCDPLLEPSQ